MAGCERRHQKLAGRKGNFHVVSGAVRRRLTSRSSLAAALTDGATIVFVPVGSPAPSPAQISGFEPLPRGGRWIAPGTSPHLARPRPAQARQLLRANLEPTLADKLTVAASTLPPPVHFDTRWYELTLLDALARTSPEDRPEAVAAATHHLTRAARFNSPDGVTLVVEALSAAMPHGAAMVDLTATKLLFNEAGSVERTSTITPRELHVGLALGEIRTVYQGTYKRTEEGWRLLGSETLVRWRRSDGTHISPPEFVGADPEALTRHTIRATAEAARVWRSMTGTSAPTGTTTPEETTHRFWTANVPPSLFGESLVAEVQAAAQSSGVPTRVLSLEITEDGPIDPETARAAMVGLAELGVRVKVDDFGTESSRVEGRRHILDLVDGIKYDRALVDGISTDSSKRTLLGIALSLFPDKTSIAEGVETAEDASALEALNVNYIQGFHFARPTEESDFLADLRADEHRPLGS